MTDGLFVGQVDGCNLMSGEEDAVSPIAGELSDGEAFATKGLWDFPHPAVEAEIGLGG
jgi:hypothetical protein